MFLDGTYQVLLIYGIAGCILCFPPLFPKWKSWVLYFNKRDLKFEKFWQNFLFYCGTIIVIVAMISMAYYNPHIFRLNFASQVDEINYFLFFSLFSFILLPLGLAFLGASAYLENSSSIKQGYFFIILLSLFALGLAGSFFHDVLWCGTRTSFYTQQWDSGYDLVPWRTFFGVASKDYRVFGFYMGVLVFILLSYVAILFNKYYSFSEERFDNSHKKKIFLIVLLSFFVLGVSLYVIDYQKLFEFFTTSISLFFGIPLSSFLFYRLGKNLAI